MRQKLRGWLASASAMAAGGARAASGRWRWCVVCQRRVPAFLPWRGGWKAAPPLMRSLGMVGSDLDRFACPRCGANDRDRHLRLYLERTGLSDRLRGARILHFAPEAPLMAWIATLGPSLHVLADLYPSREEIRRMDRNRFRSKTRASISSSRITSSSTWIDWIEPRRKSHASLSRAVTPSCRRHGVEAFTRPCRTPPSSPRKHACNSMGRRITCVCSGAMSTNALRPRDWRPGRSPTKPRSRTSTPILTG